MSQSFYENALFTKRVPSLASRMRKAEVSESKRVEVPDTKRIVTVRKKTFVDQSGLEVFDSTAAESLLQNASPSQLSKMRQI